MDLSDKLSMAVTDFCYAAGLGRTKVYQLIEAGEIRCFPCGRLRMIYIPSYLDYMRRQEEAEQANKASGKGNFFKASPNPPGRPRKARATESAPPAAE